MERKLKVYLDTSVISYLQQEDTPERMKDTLVLWKQFEAGKYEIYLSQLTLDEVGMCREPKRTMLLEYLSRICYEKMDDCQHIAAAVVHGCDCILSWNFKHIVNIKTIKGVRAITHLESYKDIDIMNPSVLVGGGE